MTGSMSGWGGYGSSPWGTTTAYLAHQRSPPHLRLAPCLRFLPAKTQNARCVPGSHPCMARDHMLPCASLRSASRAILTSTASQLWQRCCKQCVHANKALGALRSLPAQAVSAACLQPPLKQRSRCAAKQPTAHLFRNDESADEEGALLLIQNACQNATRLHALGSVAAGIATEGRGRRSAHRRCTGALPAE